MADEKKPSEAQLEKKPNEAQPEKKINGGDHINLRVLGQDNSVVQFKIRMHTPLRKLMTVYCERAGISTHAVRFRFDGNPVNETDTPTALEMEEGDTIEVYQQQTGGFC